MIALVPVSRFRVRYEVASGRPFSKFETLVLEAVRDGTTTLDALHETFQIHPRLLIEALVTLTQAGWLAVGAEPGVGFILTAEGRTASADSAPTATVVSPRQAYVVMERVTGGVVLNSDVTFVTKRQLRPLWEKSLRLRKRVDSNHLDEGQVQHLLRRRQGERVRWVGPIDQDTKDANWIAVSVDLQRQSLVHLPDVWTHRLRPLILNEVHERFAEIEPEARDQWWEGTRRRTRRPETDDPEAPRLPPTEWPTRVASDALLADCVQHEDYLQRTLARAMAGSYVMIASPVVTAARLGHLEPALREALQRGAKIDLLWGAASSQASVDAMKAIARTTRGNPAGALRFNAEPSGSSLCLMLTKLDDEVAACIGSFAWLDATDGGAANERATHMSVATSAPGAVAALIRATASLWSAIPSERLTSAPDRWRREAVTLEARAVETNEAQPVATNCVISLLSNQDHAAILREGIASASGRMLIYASQLGQGAVEWLATAERAASGDRLELAVSYSDLQLSQEETSAVEEALERLGGSMLRRPNLRSHVVIVDDQVVISSAEPLSDAATDATSRRHEYGLLIRGAEPTAAVVRRMRG